MGGFLSHSIDVESAYPSPEACKNTCHFHDPRSPSLDINRTPIMVADPVHTILDPRSPSEGIERTPITYQLPQKYRKSCTTDDASQTLDKIPPLCFEDDMDISKTEENDQLSPSFIAEIDSGDENKNDSNLESVKVLPDEKAESTPKESPPEIMPSPILPLMPNEHFIETPKGEPLTSTTVTVTPGITSIKFTNSLVSKSKIAKSQVTTKASTLPSMIPRVAAKKKSDFPTGKGFGWKKTGGCVFTAKADSEGRSPLLKRNENDLAFSPVQANALCKIQPSYKQNPLRAKNADIENGRMTDVHNKENVTILWEN